VLAAGELARLAYFVLVIGVILLYAGVVTGTELYARLLAAPLTHALFAAVSGYGLAEGRLAGRRGGALYGLAIAAALHGLYDHLVFTPGQQLAAAGIILLLWLALFAVTEGASSTQGEAVALPAPARTPCPGRL